MDTGWALDVVAKSTIVLVGAMGVVRCMRRASAAARHAVWTGALVAVLVMPVLAVMLPAWRVLPPWTGAVPASVAAPAVSVVDSGVEPAREHWNGISAEVVQPIGAVRAVENSNSVTRHVGAKRELALAWRPTFILIYFLGVLLAILPVVLGAAFLMRIEQGAERIAQGSWLGLVGKVREMLGIRRPVVLLRAAGGEVMPMTWGFWRPRILVPASAEGWSAERRRMVMVHEGAHIKRADALTQLVGNLACGVYWFHPLVWFVKYRARLEAEHACDDVVMAACRNGDGMKASAYATELLAMAGSFRASGWGSRAAIAMARGDGEQLQSRIRAILDSARNRRGVSVRGLAVGAIVAGGIVVSLAALRAADTTAPANVAKTEDFSRVIQFGSGMEMFQPGDNITITEIRGPENYVTVGNTYQIKGTYTLVSAKEAYVAASVISKIDDAHHELIDSRQRVRVERGIGDFTVVMPFLSHGYPHLSFRPGDGKGDFGGVYFWGMQSPPREPPPGGVVRLNVRATGLEFEGNATTWEELPTLFGMVQDQSKKDLMVSMDSDGGGSSDRQEVVSRITHMKGLGFRSLVLNVLPAGKMGKVFGAGTVQRDPSLYYIVIGASLEEATATGDAEFLATHGVDVSVETVARKNGAKVFVLMTVQGFPTKEGAAAFRDRIVKIGRELPRAARTRAGAWNDAYAVHVKGNGDAVDKSLSVTVLVSPTGISFEGKPTTWEELPGLLEKVQNRGDTILAMKLTTDQMTVMVRNEAFSRLAELSKKYGFRYLSDAGIQADTRATTQEGGMASAPIEARSQLLQILDMSGTSVMFVRGGKVHLETGKQVLEGESVSIIVPVKGDERGKSAVVDVQEGKVRLRAGDGAVLIGDRIEVSTDGQMTAKGGILPAMENVLGARRVTEAKPSESPSVKTGGK